MGLFSHIRTFFYGCVLAAVLPAVCLYGQSYDGSRLAKFDHAFTVGFERQVYTLYKPGIVSVSSKTRSAQENCNRILFRMKLTSRFRLETGLSYKAIDRLLSSSTKIQCFNINESCKLTVPLTVQYQLQNDRNRLRPYFGAGVQYYQHDRSNTLQNGTDALVDPILSNKLKYINIIFTQGLIYDITPDLQITESIHVIPENGIKPIGINFGIGYRLR